MELKVICPCGQKYKFDVEPVAGQMPFTVNCPVCAADGTGLANNLLLQMPAAIPQLASIAVAAAPAALRVNLSHAVAPTVASSVEAAAPSATPPRGRPVPAYTPAPAVPKYMRDNPALQNNNFFMGMLGAGLGALMCSIIVIGVRIWGGPIIVLFAHLMWGIPLGIVMGAVIAFGARFMYHGTDFTLGVMCAVVAFLCIGLTFLLLFSLFGMIFAIFGLLIGTSTAFKIASG